MSSLIQQEWASLAPEGTNVQYYAECGSTNSVATEAGAEGFETPTWYVTGRQTAGRGRRGRTWLSKPGNLYCSLLTHIGVKLSDLATLPYLVALAVRDTFIDIGCAPDTVQCKWPNDILINEKKSSGVLIESSAAQSQMTDFVVIGIGLNLANFPEDTTFPATCVKRETGIDVPPSTAFKSLSKNMRRRLVAWRPNDVSTLISEWRDASWGMGERREIHTLGETFVATLDGIDDKGGLKLRLEDGTMRVLFAGDVFSGPQQH